MSLCVIIGCVCVCVCVCDRDTDAAGGEQTVAWRAHLSRVYGPGSERGVSAVWTSRLLWQLCTGSAQLRRLSQSHTRNCQSLSHLTTDCSALLLTHNLTFCSATNLTCITTQFTASPLSLSPDSSDWIWTWTLMFNSLPKQLYIWLCRRICCLVAFSTMCFLPNLPLVLHKLEFFY